MGFRILIIVVKVRRFEGVEIIGKILSEILKLVCSCRLKQ